MKPSNHRVGHRAGNLASGTTTHLQMVESSEDKDGGRYRIRTYDFHRVKVARHFVIRELRRPLGSAEKCSGAYFSKTYEHGPESWTHKWTHVKPGWHPVFFRLTSQFGGGQSGTGVQHPDSHNCTDLWVMSFVGNCKFNYFATQMTTHEAA
jgi:hypothetical protein